MRKLSGKVALITGGNSGIGLASAKLFVAEGARVVITARRQEAVDEYNRSAPENTFAVLADASKPVENQKVFEQVAGRFGKIDILFLNAGIGKPAPVKIMPEDLYDSLWDTNFRGPFFTTQAALEHLNDHASIIYNTSIANVKGMPGMSVYAATKAGLRSLVRTLTVELAERGIRVNAISPGPVETPIWGKMDIPEEAKEDFGAQVLKQVPLGRMGKPEEIANAALFLASDDSSYVNGIELPVDGGMSQV
ncbi:MAG: SDR family oxidoreductase [Cytophagales bacterium]|nr:SDR family oxidoreductase [Cytophagales bacterium]